MKTRTSEGKQKGEEKEKTRKESTPKSVPDVFEEERYGERKLQGPEAASCRASRTSPEQAKADDAGSYYKRKGEDDKGLFFSTPKCFSRPRDWSILFSAAACLFFNLQLFFSPAMRPRKRAQSFFQPLCIILSSLFLGPETSCSEPRIFFRTPKHFWTSGAFFDSAGETHTQGDNKNNITI